MKYLDRLRESFHTSFECLNPTLSTLRVLGFTQPVTPAAGVVTSPGTDYSIAFTPPFVSKDFNKFNIPRFDGALHIEIIVSLLCFCHLFLYFLY